MFRPRLICLTSDLDQPGIVSRIALTVASERGSAMEQAIPVKSWGMMPKNMAFSLETLRFRDAALVATQ
jgi:hypothetical protein